MSKQRTEYRDDTTGQLIALVSEHVQGHRAGELVYLPKRGRTYISTVEPPIVSRIGNDREDCMVVHVIKVR